MFNKILKCTAVAAIFLAGVSQIEAQSTGFPYQVAANNKQGRPISPVGANSRKEADGTVKYLRSLGFSNVRIQERWYRVNIFSLDKRWNGRAWTYYYRAESAFENPDRNFVIRQGQGFVDGDRRTITINGVRYPYRKYEAPIVFYR